ncbi:MAG: hypothetical protein AB8B85_10635 [Paracoccaceae bacterium]
MVQNMGMTILLIIGIFAGIGVFLATMYSLTQVLLLEGRARYVHAAQFIVVMAIMTVLFLWRDPVGARVIAFALIPIAAWTILIERRFYRIFPVLIMIFALALASGYVALNPI